MIGARLPFLRRTRLAPRSSGAAMRLAGLAALPLLAGCARQAASAVASGPDVPGFWLGVWHGFIFPVAWIMSLFDASIAVYAVPNSGGWYDFGYFVGIVFLGVGSHKTRTVTKTIYVDGRGRRVDVIDQ
jgi:hypothetical protein